MARIDSYAELKQIIGLAYQHYLRRPASPSELEPYVAAYQAGTPIGTMLHNIRTSPEARSFTTDLSDVSNVSDGEFILSLAGLLFFGRGPVAEEIEQWKSFLNEDGVRRIELVKIATTAYLERMREKVRQVNDPHICWIAGTQRTLTVEEWEKKAADIARADPAPEPAGRTPHRPFVHTGRFLVSAIASLYRGGRYIEGFLENITSQSIFDRAELVIIDANSPENEADVIERYRRRFPNIVYHRVNYRIGVYDAWNIGVEMSRGKYLTNANLDDRRKLTSFELQAAVLEKHDFVDVAYQDFYYSLDSSLTFDEVAAMGFKSDLPVVTPHNLLRFNSPHNAPMWRRRLHDELGLFDTTFRSAGDWEFWLRCVAAGKTFLKINEPHVVYYYNPEGISTRRDTAGIQEGDRITFRYCSQLISPFLRMSRKQFAAAVGEGTDWTAHPSYYMAVQDRLKGLGSHFRTGN